MSGVNSSEVLLPEVETFSPIGANPATVSPKSESKIASVAAQSQVQPSVVIGTGGCTLAVPGAENMAAPYESAEVSSRNRPEGGPVVFSVGDEAEKRSWKQRLTGPIGVTVAANLVLFAILGHQFVWSSNEADLRDTTLKTASLVEEPVKAAAQSSTASKNNVGGLIPRRVKVEHFKVSKTGKLSKRKIKLSDATRSNAPVDSAADLPTTVGTIAVPRARPALPPKRVSANHTSSGSIFKELASLRDETRTKPLTIVHMGDSHIASDAFTRGIRNGLQAAYGDAGRGAILPAKAFKWTRADGVKMTTTGTWSSANSLRTKTGEYGLSGVRVWSSSLSAKMTLTTTGGVFDWAEVTVLTGPKQGKVKISAGGETKVVNAAAPHVGSKVVRVNAVGKKASVSPAGSGRTTVLNWATGREQAGVRYVNFGIVSATAHLQKRWNPTLLANDIKHLDPDLVVWGYGTNEGFNANLNMTAYRKQVASIYDTVSAAAPKADWLFLGPASGLSKKGKAAGYCNAYRIPLKLGAVRNTLKSFAEERGRHFWDWADAMGGDCAIDTWARLSPKLALSDRVHLNSAGYKRSADALVAHINKLVDAPQIVAAAAPAELGQ